MASNMTTQGQEIVECDLCQNPVSFSCRRCWVNLCDPCALLHLRISSKTGHDVVDFVKKDDDDSCFCESHPKQECSVFCKTCDLPICILCVSIMHKSHNLSELSEKIEEVLKNITQKNDRLQSFRHTLETHLDDTTNKLVDMFSFYQKKKTVVTARGEDWHKQIDEVKKKLHQKLDDLQKENEAVFQKEKRELEEMIGKIDEMNRKTTRLQKSKNLMEMMKFSRIITEQKTMKHNFPKYQECNIDGNSLQTYFGCIEKMQDIKVSLLGKDLKLDNVSRGKILEVLFVSSVMNTQAQIQNFLKGEIRFMKKKYASFLLFFTLCMFSLFYFFPFSGFTAAECKIDENYMQTYLGYIDKMLEKKLSMLEKRFISDRDSKILEVPPVSSVIDTGFPASEKYNNRLYDMSVTDDQKVWMGGQSRELKLFDLQGHLHRTVTITCLGLYISMYSKEVVYSDVKAVKKISDDDTVVTMFTTGDWRPYGITDSASGDLLVCLGKEDQSKVVRYTSTGTVLQEIQYDSQGQPLYQEAFYIAENVNGDIIVTDLKEKIVIAVDRLGKFRYKYSGKNSALDATSVATDSVGHVFVTDLKGDKIHMLNRDGRFLRYLIPGGGIKRPRAVCLIGDGEMIVGEQNTGLAKRIKLLK